LNWFHTELIRNILKYSEKNDDFWLLQKAGNFLPAKWLSVSEERGCSIRLENKAEPGGRAVYGMGLPEFSASVWSLVQRSPTECGGST
jgi:hypothetical protein